MSAREKSMARSGRISRARLAHLGGVLRLHVERGEVAGAVALVARRDGVHVEALAYQAIDD
jgi:hypothetical protein